MAKAETQHTKMKDNDSKVAAAQAEDSTSSCLGRKRKRIKQEETNEDSIEMEGNEISCEQTTMPRSVLLATKQNEQNTKETSGTKIKMEYDDAGVTASSRTEENVALNPSRKKRKIKQEPFSAATTTIVAATPAAATTDPSFSTTMLDAVEKGALGEVRHILAEDPVKLECAEQSIMILVSRLKSGDAEACDGMPKTRGALQEILIRHGLKSASELMNDAAAVAATNQPFLQEDRAESPPRSLPESPAIKLAVTLKDDKAEPPALDLSATSEDDRAESPAIGLPAASPAQAPATAATATTANKSQSSEEEHADEQEGGSYMKLRSRSVPLINADGTLQVVHESAVIDAAAKDALHDIRPKLTKAPAGAFETAKECISQIVSELKEGRQLWKCMPQTQEALRVELVKRGRKAASNEKNRVKFAAAAAIELLRQQYKRRVDIDYLPVAEARVHSLASNLMNGRISNRRKISEAQKDLKKYFVKQARRKIQQVKRKKGKNTKKEEEARKKEQQKQCMHDFVPHDGCVLLCKLCEMKKGTHEFCAHPSEPNVISCRLCDNRQKNKKKFRSEQAKLCRHFEMRRKAEELKNLQTLCLPVAEASIHALIQAAGASVTPFKSVKHVTLLEGAVAENEYFMKFVRDAVERDSSTTITGLQSFPFGGHSMHLILANVQMKFEFNLKDDWKGFVQLPQWPMNISLGTIHADSYLSEQRTMEALKQRLVGLRLETIPSSLLWLDAEARLEQDSPLSQNAK